MTTTMDSVSPKSQHRSMKANARTFRLQSRAQSFLLDDIRKLYLIYRAAESLGPCKRVFAFSLLVTFIGALFRLLAKGPDAFFFALLTMAVFSGVCGLMLRFTVSCGAESRVAGTCLAWLRL